MRVLHVMNDSVPLVGGYTSRSRCIVTHQKGAGIEPFVITSVRQGFTEADIEEFDSITYFRTNWPRSGLLKKARAVGLLKELLVFYGSISRAAAAVSPDIIHAHSPVLCAIPALAVAQTYRIPLVYEIAKR